MGDLRDTFASILETRTAADERIVAVVNDSVSSSRLAHFKQRFPKRVFNVGIAEQNQVAFAAGLAAEGLLPFACSATCFLSYRALEQIKNDVVHCRRNVTLVGNTSGVDYGPLGATHHSLGDISLLRALPGLHLLIPADHSELAAMVEAAIDQEGPFYLRLYRSSVPQEIPMLDAFRLGRVRIARRGSDCTVFATGSMVQQALGAAALLEDEGIEVQVVNVHTLSPFDLQGVAEAAAKAPFVVTVEEHAVQGALGGAVCEALAEYCPRPVIRLGFPSAHSVAGPAEAIREHYGLTAAGIAARIKLHLEGVITDG